MSQEAFGGAIRMDHLAGPFEGSRCLSANCVGVVGASSRRGAVGGMVALAGAPDVRPSEGESQARFLFVRFAPPAEVGFRLVFVIAFKPPLCV